MITPSANQLRAEAPQTQLAAFEHGAEVPQHVLRLLRPYPGEVEVLVPHREGSAPPHGPRSSPRPRPAAARPRARPSGPCCSRRACPGPAYAVATADPAAGRGRRRPTRPRARRPARGPRPAGTPTEGSPLPNAVGLTSCQPGQSFDVDQDDPDGVLGLRAAQQAHTGACTRSSTSSPAWVATQRDDPRRVPERECAADVGRRDLALRMPITGPGLDAERLPAARERDHDGEQGRLHDIDAVQARRILTPRRRPQTRRHRGIYCRRTLRRVARSINRSSSLLCCRECQTSIDIGQCNISGGGHAAAQRRGASRDAPARGAVDGVDNNVRRKSGYGSMPPLFPTPFPHVFRAYSGRKMLLENAIRHISVTKTGFEVLGHSRT